MASLDRSLYVAIDGGTTNTRVRAFVGSQAVGQRTIALGVRNVAADPSARQLLLRGLAEGISELLATVGSGRTPDLVCASGMITSSLGLQEVPHVPAPAGLDTLASHVVRASFPEVTREPVYLIPGIRTGPSEPSLRELDGIDVMRGEESEVFGLLEAAPRSGPLCVILPGSHTKLVSIDEQQRVSGSYTTLAGEAMQALAQNTVLAGSLAWPPAQEPDWQYVEDGARLVLRQGLLRGAFAVRLAALTLGFSREAAAWFFTGVVCGTDISELHRSPRWPQNCPLFVGGREPLRSVYSHLVRTLFGGSVETINDSIAELAPARGALAIARRARATWMQD